MAKEPEVQHRFRIFAETTSQKVGDLLATLTIMGLQNVGYELITDVVSFKGRKSFDTSSAELAKVFVEQNASFKAIDLVNYFAEHGRTKGSGYPALQKLIADGLIRKVGPGQYQRSDVKALAPPKSEEAETSLRGKHDRSVKDGVPNKDVIMKYIRSRSKFTLKDLSKHFVDEDRNPKSISPIISKLLADKTIKIVTPGEYIVLKKPSAAPVAKKAKATTEQKRKEARNKVDRDRRARKAAEVTTETPNHSLNGQAATAVAENNNG